MTERRLESHRQNITRYDRKIVEDIAGRFKEVREIGRIKKELGLPPLDQKRWEEVVTGAKAYGNQLGVPEGAIEEVFNVLHKYALEVEGQEDL